MNFFKGVAVFIILSVSSFFRSGGLRACRFYPSCSAYAVEAFGHFGFWKACAKSAKRLLKCHPLHAGGYDPLPLSHSHGH